MNVLAVRQDSNGDVLLVGPAIRAISRVATTVTLLCGTAGRAAAGVLPRVDDVLCWDAGWIAADPAPISIEDVRTIVSTVAERRFDRAVIFTSFHQSPLPMALVLRAAGVPFIAAISEDYPGTLLDVRHRNVPDDLHEVERALSLAQAAGFPTRADDDRRLSMRVATTNPVASSADYVVVHPGATVPARAWSAERNRQLVGALTSLGREVVVTGSAPEAALCAFVAGNDAIDLSGATDFATLGRVIADASAIVVGNTGAAHVAAAVGTPVVSIFAPTIPASRFRPWLVQHALLGRQDITCRGCRSRACPYDDQPCIEGIAVQDVLASLATFHTTVKA